MVNFAHLRILPVDEKSFKSHFIFIYEFIERIFMKDLILGEFLYLIDQWILVDDTDALTSA